MKTELSTLGYAYIGDAVYELLVRSYLAENGLLGAKNMHQQTVKIVNAKSQSSTVEKLLPFFTDEENDIFRRGRNAKVNSVPKNASEKEYHEATGLEAVLGWLWINKKKQRIVELFSIISSDFFNDRGYLL